MSENREPICPECESFYRRDFLRLVGAGTLAAVGAPLAGTAGTAETPTPRRSTPNYAAEALVKELYAGMSDDQKKQVCRPFDNPARQTVNPNRFLDVPLGKVFSNKQQELIERIVKAISSGDKGFHQISRQGTWDASRSFGNCGANLFGEPGDGKKFAFLFTGHHLTVRCDGDSQEGAAFGGPIYYGHSPNGYSPRNVFNYQTQEVLNVFDALDAKQRARALIRMGNPGEGARSVVLPGKEPRIGIAYAELSKDQQELVAQVMRALLSPFRKEDGDEVMAIIKETGGLAKIHLAFYAEDYEGARTSERQPWSFWRLEGPGFVWNYRVLPHVHTYVNIAVRA